MSPKKIRRLICLSQDAEIARLRREKAELEGKASPSVSSRAPPPNIGLGSGLLFPQLTPGVREGKPVPGTQPHDPYINGGGYADANQNAKRGRQDDPYAPRRNTPLFRLKSNVSGRSRHVRTKFK